MESADHAKSTKEEQNEKTQNDQADIGWIGTTDLDPV